jgi:transcriptional regulator with XRE-family HTH domain
MEALMHFGNRLRRIREERGLSVQDLATRAGVPYHTIYRVEQGLHASVRLDVAKKIAQALGVTLDYLAGMYDETTAETPKRRPADDAEEESHAA